MGTPVRPEIGNHPFFGRFRIFVALLGLLNAGFAFPDDPLARQILTAGTEVIGEIEHPQVRESSGLAPSRRRPEVLWTHNDSGDYPQLYALTTRGKHLGILRIRGVRARDWEDIASFVYGGKPFLLVADIGDNSARRKTCTLYAVEEPLVPETPADAILHADPAWRIDFIYEDGPRDAEAVAVDPEAGRIFILSKGAEHAALYELPLVPETEGRAVALRMATLPHSLIPKGEENEANIPPFRVNSFHPTAMDISADGLTALVLTYQNGYLFLRDPQKPWEEAFSRPPLPISLPFRPQGESGCFDTDNRSIIVGTEGRPSTLWRIVIAPYVGDTKIRNSNVETRNKFK